MSAVRKILTEGELDEFLSEREFSVIHLDAEWDGRRAMVARQMIELAGKTGESTAFGYIDVDVLQHHARGIRLVNVPACSYYRGRERVGTVVGTNQDIAGILQRVREGGALEGQGVIGRKPGEARPVREFSYSPRNFLGALQLMTVIVGYGLMWVIAMSPSMACYAAGYRDPVLPLLKYGWALVALPLAWMRVMTLGARHDPKWAMKRWPIWSGRIILMLLVMIFGWGILMAGR